MASSTRHDMSNQPSFASLRHKPLALYVLLVAFVTALNFASDKSQEDVNEPLAMKTIWLYAQGAEVLAAQAVQPEPQLLFVDKKYWIRNTELGERVNWLDGRKPCTLSNKIVIGGYDDESMVVSLDGAFGPIESDAHEILLNKNGVLLLESDQSTIDRHSGQPTESSLRHLSELNECTEGPDNEIDDDYYQFRPHPDELSWFNPDNWYSTSAEAFRHLEPHAYRIPCTDDVVMLASRQTAIGPALEAKEKYSLMGFKINFKARFGTHRNETDNASIKHLRISKLFIGEQSYSQNDLEQLVTLYGDALLEFGLQDSLLDNRDYINGDTQQLPLIIDDSSIQANAASDSQCLDEAGCICGNERREVMAAICSFIEPLVQPRDYPCEDPIKVTGYCERICATTLTIQMDPDKFSEHFISNLLDHELRETVNMFIFSRRVDYTKYEITFRLAPESNGAYELTLGKDIELARRVREWLEQPATKSFYGIKSIRVVSSLSWRKNNRFVVFGICLTVTALLSFVAFFREDKITRVILALIQVGDNSQQQNHCSERWQDLDRATLDESILLVDAKTCMGRDNTETSESLFEIGEPCAPPQPNLTKAHSNSLVI